MKSRKDAPTAFFVDFVAKVEENHKTLYHFTTFMLMTHSESPLSREGTRESGPVSKNLKKNSKIAKIRNSPKTKHTKSYHSNIKTMHSGQSIDRTPSWGQAESSY